MRQIKFRAWNKFHRKMHSVYEINFQCDIAKTQNDVSGQTYTFGFIDLELMQFTGLHDKNGVEIYEGDIVVIAGYGDYECVHPFLELYEAAIEDDIGIIKGNIYEINNY